MSIVSALRRFYSDHIDPDGIQPIHALRTSVAALIAIITYRFLDWSQAYWILISTVLIIQTYNTPVPKKKWQYLLISGSLITLSTFVASLLCKLTIVLALFLTLTTFAAVYVNVLSNEVGVAAYYVNLFCLSSGAMPANFQQTLERTGSVFAGFVIAILVCLFLWPETLNKAIQKTITQNFKRLMEFHHAINTPSYHEKAIKIRQNRLMRGFELARRIIPPEEIQSWQIMTQIEYLYEIMLTINDLNKIPEKNNLQEIVYKDTLKKYEKNMHRLNQLFAEKTKKAKKRGRA